MASPNNRSEFEQLQEIVKDREVWRATIHRVAKNQTGLSNWTPPNNTTSSMPGHFSKWMFGAGSWNRTLLRPLHPLTWYCRTCRNGAHLSGKRESMNNRLVTSFSVFSLLCSAYLSHVKVSVLFYQRVIFCCPVGAVYLGVLFLVRLISMDQHYANFPLTFKPL